MTHAEPQVLMRTPLHGLHRELGAKMVPFAGYEMPVQYKAGILAEHAHTRAAAGLFDVSHMGQVSVTGGGAARALESLVPADLSGLEPGQMRYTQFTTEQGGIIDDLMVANRGEDLFLVVNAARKEVDLLHLSRALAGRCRVELLADLALLALQGPKAASVLARLAPDSRTLRFMWGARVTVGGVPCHVTRSGYTGEDGFEISVPAAEAPALARRLLAEPEVAPIGLGARDSLRLEAGLCLYGHDIDETTTPVEAALEWSIPKRRRVEGGFPGSGVIASQLERGAERRRVGLLPEDRAPAREHTPITDRSGAPLGTVTSGGFGPSLGRPVAMGYVKASHARPGVEVRLVVRGVPRPARVAALPFRPPGYHRG